MRLSTTVRLPCWRALLALAFSSTAGTLQAVEVPTTAPWDVRLVSELSALDRQSRPEIGVYVRDLTTGTAALYKADEDWYIASMVKVPVAIAVMRGVEAGQFTLDTPLRIRAADYVDGGGATNRHPVATPLTVRYLMEQMIIHSDNTASDMLIGLVGLSELNALVKSLVPEGFHRITTLAEVRRQVYGLMTPAARQLSGQDLLRIHRERGDGARLAMLSQITGVPVARFKLKSLESAYTAYYAGGYNSARLDAYGELLALLFQSHALNAESTDYMVKLMERTATGPQRIKAGLPPGVRYAHKTGTQRRRVCDSGLVRVTQIGRDTRAIVVACARGELSLTHSETALREVGNAICRSGLLTHGVIDAPSCHAVAHAERVPSRPAVARPVSPRR